MGIENWRLFIQERLRAMDPSINLDEGSPASVQVVEPVVGRLSPDPIDTNIELFILTRLQQEYPQLFAQEGSAMADLFAKPARVLFEPFRRETRTVRSQSSLEHPYRLTSDEADSLMKNFFMDRQSGSYAKVKVRVYYQNPVSANIGSSNVAFTGNGLRFLPTSAQSITAEGMLFNTDASGLYYFDVNYQAERPGTMYNIGPSQIIGVTGVSAATRATNLAKASPGSNDETTAEFIDRVEQSIGERSANALSGLVAVLRENFADLTIMQAIGFNDAEMHRDILKGGSYGPVLYSGTDGDTTPDGGSPAGRTAFFDVAAASIDFTTTFGPIGFDLSGYALTVWYIDGAVMAPHTFELKQVEGASRVSISDDYARADSLIDSLVGASYWAIQRQDVITLSDIPGGLLFPDVATDETVTVPHDEVHVGGCVDVYVRGGDIENATVPLSLVSDEEAIARREDARTTGGSDQITLQDLTAAEWALVTEGRTSLYLEQGADLGAYRIIEKMTVGPPCIARVPSAMTAPGAVTDISYVVVDDLDIDLVDPREVRYEGTDLRTVAGLAGVQTLGGVPNFVSIGVVDTDYVRILNGDDAGEYSITGGGVGAATITLSVGMTTTASPLQYEIYRKQDGIERPLLRVKTVEILDSSLDPTGSYVPYKHPVDTRSNSFQNPGREPRAGTDVTITQGTYLSMAAGSTSVFAVTPPTSFTSWYALGVDVGDIVNINDSDNQGYYTIVGVGGITVGLAADELTVSVAPTWTVAAADFTIGPPSYGSFRLYFLDPLTFEASYANTLIGVELGLTTLNYRPDPDIWHEYVPTETVTPTTTLTAGGNTIVPYEVGGTPNIDLKVHELAVGDRVEITYAPLVGSADIAATGPLNLDGQTLLIDVGDGDETVTFSGTSLDISAIVAQINAQLSQSVAFDYNPAAAPAENYVGLRGDLSITIENNPVAGDATAAVFGGNRQTNNHWLPPDAFAGQATDNDSPEKDFYLVASVAAFPTGAVTLTTLAGGVWAIGALPGGAIGVELGHYFHIERQGVQRMSSSAMLEQGADEHGLYYFDVECISQGHGNSWNIGEDLQGTVTGYQSEGWEITTEDEDTSFSTAEEPFLRISPRVLIAGVDDDPSEKEELPGRSIQIAYERDPIVEQVQEFLRSPQYRILVSNPLVRSLLPIFVRTSIEYRSGGTEADVRAELAPYIESILPSEQLEVDDLAQMIRSTGGTKVTHPVTLLGIAHQLDRTIVTERSVDQISNARLSALIPDDDGTTAAGASYIRLVRTI